MKPIIKNKRTLAQEPFAKEKKLVLEALEAGVRAAAPAALVRACIPKIPKPKGKIYVVGAGKACGAMAEELDKHFRVEKGLVAVPDGEEKKFRTKKITLVSSTHPKPGLKSVTAAKKILALADDVSEKDAVICIFSGGGSALLSLPAEGLSVKEKAELSIELMKRGADIHELNCVRRHLSQIKGGQLAKAFSNANAVYSLLLSDVVGGKIEDIASGPCAPDPTTIDDAKRVLEKYGLEKYSRLLVETPKPSDKFFGRVQNIVIGGNSVALKAATAHLAKAGARIAVFPEITGKARAAAKNFVGFLSNGISFCAGGETTTKVVGNGKGGRNQELALALLIELAHSNANYVFASIGTDGIDGNSNAAGAIVDSGMNVRDAASYLNDNDSNSFFKKAGREIITGRTGTNVNDLMIGIAIKNLKIRKGSSASRG